MKDIQLITLKKYNDVSKFEKISHDIYKAVCDYENDLVKKGDYVTAFSFTLEENSDEVEDTQYPLDDILDKFYAYVSDFVQYENGNPVMIVELCTADSLDCMQELIKIAGKHVYNKASIEDGKSYVELIIE